MQKQKTPACKEKERIREANWHKEMNFRRSCREYEILRGEGREGGSGFPGRDAERKEGGRASDGWSEQ